ncbi:MAG: O-antigen ligase family protein, partial [Actinomycetota bacterium]
LTAWTMVRSRTRKWALGGFMVASLFPFVVSLDRGAWFSLGLGLAYATLRFGLRGNRRALAGAVAALVLGVGVVALTPLGGVVVDRLKNPHSNEGRMLLYQEAIKRTKESPVLGYGAPVKSVRPDTPSVGTHGQLWLVLVSHGVPAALLFFAWWIALLLRTRRGTAPFGVWGHAVVLISLLQMGFYEQLAAPIHITMVAAALVLREMRARQEGSAGQIAVQVRELSTVGG